MGRMTKAAVGNLRLPARMLQARPAPSPQTGAFFSKRFGRGHLPCTCPLREQLCSKTFQGGFPVDRSLRIAAGEAPHVHSWSRTALSRTAGMRTPVPRPSAPEPRSSAPVPRPSAPVPRPSALVPRPSALARRPWVRMPSLWAKRPP
eukprot:141229-Chlamydomonas_euryale.AAC.2